MTTEEIPPVPDKEDSIAEKRPTDEELKQIAKDLYAGKIFSDRHMHAGEMNLFQSVFMPFALMPGDQGRAFIEKNDVALIYEYTKEAGPRSINGLPMFFSFRYLNTEEAKKMHEYYEKIAAAMEGI